MSCRYSYDGLIVNTIQRMSCLVTAATDTMRLGVQRRARGEQERTRGSRGTKNGEVTKREERREQNTKGEMRG